MKASFPKLAKDLAALVGIARKETSVEKIEAALIQAREKVAAAGRDRDAAEAEYQEGLLDQPDTALAALLDRKAAATIERDRAEALVRALTDRLAAARNADERAERQKIHDDAKAASADIVERFGPRYAALATEMRGLLADLAAADLAVERANAQASEFGHLPSVESAVRGAPWTPEETVAVDTVEHWVIDGRSAPVTLEQAAEVRPSTRHGDGPDRGILYIAGTGWDVTRRAFTRTRYREAVSYGDAPSLLRAVSLPPLHPLGDAFVTPDAIRSPDTSLAHLTAERRPDPVIERPVRERLEMLPPEATKDVVAFEPRERPRSRTPSAKDIRAESTPSAMLARERRAG